MAKFIHGVKVVLAIPAMFYLLWWASETVAGREAMQEIFGD
jgi:hypothetical protein